MPKGNRLYHSALVKGGPQWLKLTGPVKKGQYGYFVEVENADGEKLNLNAENEQIGQQLEQCQRGTWYEFTASGTKEKATVEIVDESGTMVEPPATAPSRSSAPPSRPGAAPKRAGPRETVRQEGASLSKIMRACLAVAHDLEEAYEKHYGAPMSENARTMAISLAIEINRRGGDLSTLTEG